MPSQEEQARAELVEKVRALAKKRGETPDALYRSYDRDQRGGLSADELLQLLSDAGVGNSFTRGMYVTAIMKKLDTDADQGVSRAELDGILSALEPAPPSSSTPAPMGPPPPPPSSGASGLPDWLVWLGVGWALWRVARG